MILKQHRSENIGYSIFEFIIKKNIYFRCQINKPQIMNVMMSKCSLFSTVVFLLFPIMLSGQGNQWLLENVHWIDVENGKLQKATAILVEDGQIKKIGAIKKVKKIPEAQRINLQGKYLMPGLVDGHIHLFQSGGLYTRPDALDLTEYRSYEEERNWLKNNAEDLLKRYLKCGISTVFDVGGPSQNLLIRDEFKGRKDLPTLHITGPLISTYCPEELQVDDPPIIKVNSPEEARREVQKQIPLKPDFIKIWYIVLPTQSAKDGLPIVKATIEESKKHNLPVIVHATELETARLAVEAGASVLVHSVEDKEVDEAFIQLLKENQVVYIPTLVVGKNYFEVFQGKKVLTDHDFEKGNPYPLGSLNHLKHLPKPDFIKRLEEMKELYQPRLDEQDKIRASNLMKLSKAGVHIVTGTDAGNIGTLHGTSYIEELEAMKKAGMTNSAILKASTINAASFLNKENNIGSIQEGKIADLIILDENPLEDLSSLKNPSLILHQGHLINPDTLIIDSPEDLVQKQLNAYNARNLEAFLTPYSDSIKIYNFGETTFQEGKETMRKNYGKMFEQLPDLHCELRSRMVLGNKIIDHERVVFDASRPKIEAIAIYIIKHGKIQEVHFLSPQE